MAAATESIRAILTKQPSSAKIFYRFDIDLCGQADQSLEEACQELQLSVDQVLEKLADSEVLERGGMALDPESLSLERLIQYIVRIHHHCVRQELPRLAEMALKVATLRSGQAPELTKIAALVEKLRAEMYVHIQKEEQVLFPFISRIDQDPIVVYPPGHACFRSVAHPIFMMEQEYESADHLVAELIHLTNHFEPPSLACATHIALFSGLREFAANLGQHVHLENDVLFPRAIQREAELKARI
jgi:regulator of cell morphogenesis and NO signaling